MKKKSTKLEAGSVLTFCLALTLDSRQQHFNIVHERWLNVHPKESGYITLFSYDICFISCHLNPILLSNVGKGLL